MKKKVSIQEMWDNIKWYNYKMPEGKEETSEDTTAEKFPKTLKKVPNHRFKQLTSTLRKYQSPKKTSPKYILTDENKR